MHEFYRAALRYLLILIALSSVIASLGIARSYLHDALTPADKDHLNWQLETRADTASVLQSTVQPRAGKSRIAVDFRLAPINGHNASASMVFRDRSGKVRLVDLSRYGTISFTVRCAPANTLSMSISTFNKGVTNANDFLTFRPAHTYFSCGETASRIELDLTHLVVPDWWLNMFQVVAMRQDYRLDAVPMIEFGVTFLSPTGVRSQFEIDGITLNGRDYRPLQLAIAALVLGWSAYAVWFFRGYARALRAHLQQKIQHDLPLLAYQHLQIEPHRDREKGAILRVMATRYSDPEFDLDTLVTEAGSNRNKVNEILKAELGYTFSTYLNKLRLTEAARLLAEAETATIAEIAYLVGYKNVTYFNRLFKEEYHCTPKAFRQVCRPAS